MTKPLVGEISRILTTVFGYKVKFKNTVQRIKCRFNKRKTSPEVDTFEKILWKLSPEKFLQFFNSSNIRQKL